MIETNVKDLVVSDHITYPHTLRIDVGTGNKGMPQHVHTATMGWEPYVVSILIYTSGGAPLSTPDGDIHIYPGKVVILRADEWHGVTESDGEGRSVTILSGIPTSP